MTSGKPKKPKTYVCKTCKQTYEHWGNSRKFYCSPACKYPERYTGFKNRQKLDPQEKAERQRQRARNTYAKRRETVKQYKLDQKQCADCGMQINEHTIVCIDLDHRDPTTKTFTIAYKMASVTEETLKTELAKCDAVCRNCHAYRTHNGKHWANKLSQPQGNRK